MELEAEDLGLDLGPPDFEDDLCKYPPCPSQLPPVWGAVGGGRGGTKVYMKKFCIFYETLAGILYDFY